MNSVVERRSEYVCNKWRKKYQRDNSVIEIVVYFKLYCGLINCLGPQGLLTYGISAYDRG
jgi:hypothetical protein